MDKEKLHGFATRVTQANPSELVVVIFEAAIASIEEGRTCLEAEDMDRARAETDRAKGLIDELLRSLDMQYTISHYLRQLYVYAYHEICHGIALRQPELFDHATGVLEGLLESFREVAKQDTSEPVMKNSQAIYAGLTYGRDSLNETIGVGVDFKRGFEA